MKKSIRIISAFMSIVMLIYMLNLPAYAVESESAAEELSVSEELPKTTESEESAGEVYIDSKHGVCYT